MPPLNCSSWFVVSAMGLSFGSGSMSNTESARKVTKIGRARFVCLAVDAYVALLRMCGAFTCFLPATRTVSFLSVLFTRSTRIFLIVLGATNNKTNKNVESCFTTDPSAPASIERLVDTPQLQRLSSTESSSRPIVSKISPLIDTSRRICLIPVLAQRF